MPLTSVFGARKGKKKFPVKEQSTSEIPVSELALPNFPSREEQQIKDCLVSEHRAIQMPSGYTFVCSLSPVPLRFPWVIHTAAVQMSSFTIHPRKIRNNGKQPQRQKPAQLVTGYSPDFPH